MIEDSKVIEILKNELGFSESSIKKLEKFHNYLLEYNKRYNLISKKTEKSTWIRQGEFGIGRGPGFSSSGFHQRP